jgi:hypothetical protein
MRKKQDYDDLDKRRIDSVVQIFKSFGYIVWLIFLAAISFLWASTTSLLGSAFQRRRNVSDFWRRVGDMADAPALWARADMESRLLPGALLLLLYLGGFVYVYMYWMSLLTPVLRFLL